MNYIYNFIYYTATMKANVLYIVMHIFKLRQSNGTVLHVLTIIYDALIEFLISTEKLYIFLCTKRILAKIYKKFDIMK